MSKSEITEAVAYQYAAQCLAPIEKLVEPYKLQGVADKIASAILDAARRSVEYIAPELRGVKP